jgi:ketosteroid isomerase-like protein
MSAHDNIQTTKGVYAAFKRGDRAAMLAVFAENIKLVSEPGAGELPWAGVYEGHAGVETQQDRLAEHVEVSDLEELDVLVSESQVAVVLRLEMTLKKDGQKVSFPRYVQLWTFDASGKVASVCEVYDPTELLAAWSV